MHILWNDMFLLVIWIRENHRVLFGVMSAIVMYVFLAMYTDFELKFIFFGMVFYGVLTIGIINSVDYLTSHFGVTELPVICIGGGVGVVGGYPVRKMILKIIAKYTGIRR